MAHRALCKQQFATLSAFRESARELSCSPTKHYLTYRCIDFFTKGSPKCSAQIMQCVSVFYIQMSRLLVRNIEFWHHFKFLCIFVYTLLKIADFLKKKSVKFAMKFGILLNFQKLQENFFIMAASIGFLELIF